MPVFIDIMDDETNIEYASTLPRGSCRWSPATGLYHRVEPARAVGQPPPLPVPRPSTMDAAPRDATGGKAEEEQRAENIVTHECK